MAVMERAPASRVRAIADDPTFQELVQTRTRFGWILSIVMLAVYFGFIVLVAYGKTMLATKIGGGTTSLGIVLGLAVIIFAFLLTGVYVSRANGRFDRLTNDLKRRIG